jgi:hypothetical protein
VTGEGKVHWHTQRDVRRRHHAHGEGRSSPELSEGHAVAVQVNRVDVPTSHLVRAKQCCWLGFDAIETVGLRFLDGAVGAEVNGCRRRGAAADGSWSQYGRRPVRQPALVRCTISAHRGRLGVQTSGAAPGRTRKRWARSAIRKMCDGARAVPDSRTRLSSRRRRGAARHADMVVGIYFSRRFLRRRSPFLYDVQYTLPNLAAGLPSDSTHGAQAAAPRAPRSGKLGMSPDPVPHAPSKTIHLLGRAFWGGSHDLKLYAPPMRRDPGAMGPRSFSIISFAHNPQRASSTPAGACAYMKRGTT